MAIIPAHSLFEGAIGTPVSLEIHVFGIPEIQSDEIWWINPSQQINRETSGVTFLDGKTRLLIESLVMSDNGTYFVQILRRGRAVHISFDLLVHSKLSGSNDDNKQQKQHILSCTESVTVTELTVLSWVTL